MLNLEQRTKVLVKVEAGQSYRAIAKEMNINKDTVTNIVKKMNATGSLTDKARSGQPAKTTPRVCRSLVRMSLADRHQNAIQLRARLETEHDVTISASTVRRRLKDAGLKACVAAKKPLLSTTNRKKRLEFAKGHKDWTVQDWKKLL